jgi:hypothetical protein
MYKNTSYGLVSFPTGLVKTVTVAKTHSSYSDCNDLESIQAVSVANEKLQFDRSNVFSEGYFFFLIVSFFFPLENLRISSVHWRHNFHPLTRIASILSISTHPPFVVLALRTLDGFIRLSTLSMRIPWLTSLGTTLDISTRIRISTTMGWRTKNVRYFYKAFRLDN